MHIDLYIEMRDEDVEESGLVDIGVKALGSVGKNKDRPKEVDEDCVHYGNAAETGLDAVITVAEQAEELHDKLLELHIIEDRRIFRLIKEKAEVRIIDDILNLAYVLLVVAILRLEA